MNKTAKFEVMEDVSYIELDLGLQNEDSSEKVFISPVELNYDSIRMYPIASGSALSGGFITS